MHDYTWYIFHSRVCLLRGKSPHLIQPSHRKSHKKLIKSYSNSTKHHEVTICPCHPNINLPWFFPEAMDLRANVHHHQSFALSIEAWPQWLFRKDGENRGWITIEHWGGIKAPYEHNQKQINHGFLWISDIEALTLTMFMDFPSIFMDFYDCFADV